jgi:hypothetical protein
MDGEVRAGIYCACVDPWAIRVLFPGVNIGGKESSQADASGDG